MKETDWLWLIRLTLVIALVILAALGKEGAAILTFILLFFSFATD